MFIHQVRMASSQGAPRAYRTNIQLITILLPSYLQILPVMVLDPIKLGKNDFWNHILLPLGVDFPDDPLFLDMVFVSFWSIFFKNGDTDKWFP